MLFDILSGADYSFGEIITYVISALAVVFITLPVHEFAHAFAANKLGDPTARYQGRLSVNPLVHIDYMGAIFIILFGFGWAKPVPVNTRYFKNPKRDMAITAVAGPCSNLVVSLVAMLIRNILSLLIFKFQIYNNVFLYIISFFSWVAIINISLAVFNLIPIPPLDGSRLLTAVLPSKQYYMLMRYERYFFIILIALLWVGVLDIPLDFLTQKIRILLEFIAGLPFKAFL